MGFDFTGNLLKASGKWKEAQETIYETLKEITKEEKYSKLGTLSWQTGRERSFGSLLPAFLSALR